MDHDQGDDQRDHGKEDRLAGKLPDQLLPLGAEHFPDAHLLCPAGGPCRGKVHEVHAGDQENEHGQGREDVDVPDVAVGA